MPKYNEVGIVTPDRVEVFDMYTMRDAVVTCVVDRLGRYSLGRVYDSDCVITTRLTEVQSWDLDSIACIESFEMASASISSLYPSMMVLGREIKDSHVVSIFVLLRHSTC